MGVPPEYLVHCGLSRELIYFAFTELRLRLPLDFDTAGIPQYSPEFLESLFESQKPVGDPDAVDSGSRVQPQTIQLRSEKQAGVSSGSASVTPTISVSGSPSLHDIEQQRRRELLARKAVMASRKGKRLQTPALRSPSPQSTNASPANTPFKDIEMASADITPAATVDDFLNSIGPTKSTSLQRPPGSPPPSGKAEPDGMDVDDIPGLGGTWPSEALNAPVVKPPLAPAPTSVPSTSALPPNTPGSVGTPTGPLSSGESTPSLPDPSVVPQRRGIKRPVAADFVDAERSHTHAYYPSFPNGQPQTYPSYAKRKTGGFAGITSARRCVIDLSDSEDEEYSEDADAPSQLRSLPASRHGSFNSHFATNVSLPTGGNSLSGATLLEKELEIKRMREMIAQKEQLRLRKLVGIPASFPFVTLTSDDRLLREVLQDRARHRVCPPLPPPSQPLPHPCPRRRTPPLLPLTMLLWRMLGQLRHVRCIPFGCPPRTDPVNSLCRGGGGWRCVASNIRPYRTGR